MTDFNEASEWIQTLSRERYKPVTIRTTDREEIARFSTQLPADYAWIDGSDLLQEKEK